jgi:hypothetical protein
MREYAAAGWRPIEGFQLRYIYFIDPTARQRLTVPVLPFSRIDDMGARMYKGNKPAPEASGMRPPNQVEEGGSTPTPALNDNA